MLIRCTKKAQKRLHLKPSDLSEVTDSEDMTEWYCNVAVFERKPYFLLTHRLTLFAFLMPLKGNTDIIKFGKKFRDYARDNLNKIGFDQADMSLVLDDEKDCFAKTVDRAVLGSMVDYVNMTKYQVEYNGGMENLDLDDLSWLLNDVPMSAIGMDHPRLRMRSLIED